MRKEDWVEKSRKDKSDLRRRQVSKILARHACNSEAEDEKSPDLEWCCHGRRAGAWWPASPGRRTSVRRRSQTESLWGIILSLSFSCMLNRTCSSWPWQGWIWHSPGRIQSKEELSRFQMGDQYQPVDGDKQIWAGKLTFNLPWRRLLAPKRPLYHCRCIQEGQK